MQCLQEVHHPGCRFCHSANVMSWTGTKWPEACPRFGCFTVWWCCPYPPAGTWHYYHHHGQYVPSTWHTCVRSSTHPMRSEYGLLQQTRCAQARLRSVPSYFNFLLHFISKLVQMLLPLFCALYQLQGELTSSSGLCCWDLGTETLTEITAQLWNCSAAGQNQLFIIFYY